ncbi:HEAT repeat domain-containing protein [Pelistega sp. NLN82]|uniref:HEAT repeat domain-containing protein n=1 Tax=Pelistega ratti TaxID=2652177 RepID=A0A6L9Y7N9_9BURK|nr:HEAT repeat domain-containing protein [Pelistega ratti]NEN75798.1 HEAT repeat domain-containing protein [Pelistega ratti]
MINDIIHNFQLARQTTSFKIHNDLIKKLLEYDNDTYYQIHLDFISEERGGILHERLCRGFAKRTEKAANFLLKKIISHEIKNILIADIIQILGLMKCYKVLPLINNFLENKDEIVRYKCIIVLGWLGGGNEIDLLLKTLKSNYLPYIRGFSATAMRQILFNHSEYKEYIVEILANQIFLERDKLVLAMIIITLQDVLNYDFGLKERDNGDILGDLGMAIDNIRKYIANNLKMKGISY